MMLVKYVKDSRGQRVGVVVATGKYHIGWSKCNFAKGDKFNKDWGKFIARRRAAKHSLPEEIVEECDMWEFCDDHHIPHSVVPDFFDMVRRADHYFKDDYVPF